MAFAALCKYGTLQFSAAYGLIAGVLFAVASAANAIKNGTMITRSMVSLLGRFMV